MQKELCLPVRLQLHANEMPYKTPKGDSPRKSKGQLQCSSMLVLPIPIPFLKMSSCPHSHIPPHSIIAHLPSLRHLLISQLSRIFISTCGYPQFPANQPPRRAQRKKVHHIITLTCHLSYSISFPPSCPHKLTDPQPDNHSPSAPL